MPRDQGTNDRLSKLLQQLISVTEKGELHWERQLGSAHRYARWKNNLLILGPAEPLSEIVANKVANSPDSSKPRRTYSRPLLDTRASQ